MELKRKVMSEEDKQKMAAMGEALKTTLVERGRSSVMENVRERKNNRINGIQQTETDTK